MKSKTCYVTIKKLEELTGLKCLHLDLDTLTDELIIDSLKSELSSEEYPYYYIFKHKSDEINADSKKIFLGVFILGSIKPFDSSKIHHVFDLYKKSHSVNTIPKEEYYLSKQEFVSRGLTHSDAEVSITSTNSKAQKPSFVETSYSNESKVNTMAPINESKSYTSDSNEVVEEDLNEAARNFRDYTFGVINNPKHMDKIANIEGVEILGVNDASQCTYFKVASENTNKVLGQSVRIQRSVLDSDLLDFYKKDN